MGWEKRFFTQAMDHDAAANEPAHMEVVEAKHGFLISSGLTMPLDRVE